MDERAEVVTSAHRLIAIIGDEIDQGALRVTDGATAKKFIRACVMLKRAETILLNEVLDGAGLTVRGLKAAHDEAAVIVKAALEIMG